ncbi:MAG TPA: DUF1015 domain-containing protein [Acidobacteria bacterium]|nr:DUF1015 domain-containing protein [Acidobacteriota bacterium]HIN10657.1 DUF1015 domain-containing protein [Acidobacteriota bacterium]
MAVVSPFRALRPEPRAAAAVAAVPYDVVSTEEARALAADVPLSFLHVTRPEIDLAPGTDPHDPVVYETAVANLARVRRVAPLVVEAEPALYVYRLRDGGHAQTGLAGCYSLDEYDSGAIKKHERTRPDKEDDRTRHMVAIEAQTGVVFLTYRQTPLIDAEVERVCRTEPLFDFEAADAVHHTVWRATREQTTGLVGGFAAVPTLYIADGHHRAASAARARQTLGRRATGAAGPAERDSFLAVAFPDRQTRILPYNRALSNLAGATPEAFLQTVSGLLPVEPTSQTTPDKGTAAMYVGGRWYQVGLSEGEPSTPRDPVASLDVSVLQERLLGPVLEMADIRTDARVRFVGGVRGTAELERLVDSGQAAVAFSLAAVTVPELLAIADAGAIMPPKSTWFEPKLRDGLLTHLI